MLNTAPSSNLEFLRTYELKEFKELMGTSKLKVFENKDKKYYVRFYKDDKFEMVFPVSSRNTIEDILGDPVISEAHDKAENKLMYFLHKRSESGDKMFAEL